jgi:mannose-1-phosphate guanylyltransferase/phosphomannomutase
MMLLALMADTELSLSQLNSRIPATSVLSRSVPVAWHRRGAAMRAVRLATDESRIDALDGVRVIGDDETWCLVLPDDDQATFTLFAEATSDAAASALLDRWQAVVEAAS